MDKEYKKLARKEYLHYFRIWFLIIGVLAVVCLGLYVVKHSRAGAPRTNTEAPDKRVYDYGEVLTEEEEQQLERYIAERERKLQIDIVLLTICQPVEGEEAREKYGLRYTDWEWNMQDIADDFWDENHFGYNVGYEGDGILLLYNWYEGQRGEVLSTSGKVEEALSSRDINRIFDAVDSWLDRDLYRAYKAYVDKTEEMYLSSGKYALPWAVVFLLPAAVALSYAVTGAKQSKAQNTVAVNAYVEDGKPVVNDARDDLLRKNVVTRKIETSSGSGGGGHSSSGGGGHHHSSSGASHGGGSRRH